MHTRLHNQEHSSTSAQNNPLQSRPFADESEQVTELASEPNTPSLQARLEHSSRSGHNFGNIPIFSPQRKPTVQTKLTVGEPDDQYEQEADRVAEQVMTMSAPTAQPIQRQEMPEEEDLQMKPLASSITPLIQRETAPEEEDLQMKSADAPFIQREQMPEEEEALQTKPELAVIQRDVIPEDEEPVQTKTESAAILQRQVIPEEEEAVQTKPSLQRSSDDNTQVGNTLEQQLNNSVSGSPLSEDVRAFMEPRFGADFSGVRVHTDSNAVQMNRDLNAQAFAHKQDIYFGAGKSPGKDALTAHELTHVVQQTSSVQPKISERIQRGGGPSTPSREFIRLTSSSPSEATLKLFERHTHTWRIWNWREAPPRTYFHWGGGITDDKLSLVDMRSQDRGATSLIRVEAQKPGNTQIQGTPVHQVPGGTEVTGETQHADITVAQPTLQLLSTMPRRADGSPAQSDHLSRGDRLIARVKVGNVDGQRMEDPGVIGTGGQGYQLMSVGDIRPVQRFSDGRSYDIELTANAEGSVNLNLELGIGTIPLGVGPKVRVAAEIEHDRQHFLNLCGECDTIIERTYTRANTVMEKLSAAYGDAWDRHVRTLEAQDASNRLAGEIILAAALAFIPGAAGGQVGLWMNRVAKDTFLVDAVKDMAKAGTRVAQSAVVGGNQGGGVMRPMDENPRTWRVNYIQRVNSEKEHVLDILRGWKRKANASDPNFYMNFDPVEQTERTLTQDGKPLSEQPIPDQAENARLFELGFWRKWLETYAYSVAMRYTCGGVYYEVEENQGKKIRDRINALGENGDQWLEQYGGVSRRRAEEEVARRNNSRWG